MIYGLIFSAGNQKRFELDSPKSLVKIGKKPLLDYNIRNLDPYCNKIFVICNKNNESYFQDYNHISIKSGNGSGDAVLKVLSSLPLFENDKVFIQWGDSYCDPQVVKKTFLNGIFSKNIVIPCETTTNPYVQIIPKNNNSLQIRYLKYKEYTYPGFHDLSLFFSDAIYLRKCLQEYNKKILTNKDIISSHENEFEFLDMFNFVDAKGEIIEIKYHNCFSFNKLSDLEDISCISDYNII